MISQSLAEGVRWSFRDASQSKWRSAEVPGCVHRDLLRHELIPNPFHGRNEEQVQWVGERDWEYRAVFAVQSELLKEATVDLVVDGIDTVATVMLNGVKVGRSETMFAGWRTDVRPLLRPEGNELIVRIDSAIRYIETKRRSHRPREINDPVGGCTRIRKQQCQFGWDWAPRLVTSGIWRDLRLEAWTQNRLVDMRVRQRHDAQRGVLLEFSPELAFPGRGVRVEGTVSREGRVVALVENGKALIEQPLLWWPNGHGGQPLYEIDLKVSSDSGVVFGWWTRRLGLRTVELSRKRDRWGESFQFIVNGRRIFAKGASWIPAHSFVAGLNRSDYEPLVRSAAQANMNMLRVWGGGVYEQDAFYDLCDELGLLVWQDFMFACTLYPGDSTFLRLVKAEAEFQVRRLRGRTCLALWCGNNELELLNAPDLAKSRQRKAYTSVFREILPEAIARLDGETPYWRSSPSQSEGTALADPERSGNAHFWDVWHLLKPVKQYEEKVFRFVSEFGMQSLPSVPVAETFCEPGQYNLFSPVMENHQKNALGNRIILEYIARRYRFPRDYGALAYLSQLNQAYCMQVGVEHYRRNQQRCGGALYWQLNDCWPCASWSSLEFGGRWKALHHEARRFFAPLLVSARILGDDSVGIGNRHISSVREVQLYTVCDAPAPEAVRLGWELWHVDGRVLDSGEKRVTLRPGKSVRQKTLNLVPWMEAHGRTNLYLRISLGVRGRCVSEDTVLLCPPRMLELQRSQTRVELERQGDNEWTLSLISPVFQHRFMFDIEGQGLASSSDNWFDLYPGRKRTVSVRLTQPLGKAALMRALHFRSLVDSYD